MRKALVVGSEGNIGAPLVRHLRAEGYDVLESDIRPGWRDRFIMADINHPIDLLPAFDWGPEVVFLLSAMVSRVTCEQASSLAIATNLGGINNVLQLCKRVGARLVFFSTSEVYGPDCDPMDDAASTPRPNNRYGLSKLLGEQLVEYEVRKWRPSAPRRGEYRLVAPARQVPHHRMIRGPPSAWLVASPRARARPAL